MTRLLTPEDVAEMFDVDLKLVERLAEQRPVTHTYGFGDRSPGHMAVASLSDDTFPSGNRGVRVVFVGYDGIHSMLCTDREARRLLNLTLERLDEEARSGDEPTKLRRIQGGSWTGRWRCPDGVVRQFIEKRSTKKQQAREAMRPSVRWAVLERDGFRCRYCGRAAPEVELVVDHVRSVIDGGTNDESNLVAACFDCNSGKGRRSVGEAA